MRLAAVRIGPARNVAGREDPGRARFEIGVHDDAAINGEPGLFGELDPRAHADAGDHEIGLERAAALELHLLAVDGARRVLEVENDAVLLVQRAHEVAHLRTEDALHRPFVRRHHMDFDVAGAQGRRDFEPDEARAHHDRPARRPGALDDGPAVGERAQRADMRLIGARDRQANRLGAGGEQQPVVRDLAPVGERDLARTRVDTGDVRLEPQVDAVLRIEAVRTQRHPILGRLAGEVVLGEVRPVDGRRVVIAQHDDAALVLLAPQISRPRQIRQRRRRR